MMSEFSCESLGHSQIAFASGIALPLSHTASIFLLQDGLTPLERAEERNKTGVVKLLRSRMRVRISAYAQPQRSARKLSSSLIDSTVDRDELRPRSAPSVKSQESRGEDSLAPKDSPGAKRRGTDGDGDIAGGTYAVLELQEIELEERDLEVERKEAELQFERKTLQLERRKFEALRKHQSKK